MNLTSLPEPASTADPDARRHPHWDVRHAFSNYSFLIIGSAAGAVFAFFNIWLATRALGANGYGTVAALIAAAQVVLIIGVNWTAVALFRFGSQEFVEHGRLAESFWTRAAIAAATLCALAATYPWWSGFLVRTYHLSTTDSFLLVAFIGSSALTVQTQYALQAAKRPRSTALVLVLERALVSVGLLMLMATHRALLSTVVLAYVSGAVIAAGFGMFLLRDLLHPVSTSAAMAHKMLRFSLPLVANGVVGYLASNFIDAFFLLKYLSFAALGVYSVAFQYVGVLLQLPTLAGSLLLPFFVTQIAHGRGDRIRRFLTHALPVMIFAWSMICIGAALVGSLIFPRVLGAEFIRIGDAIWPLAVAAALAGPVLFGLAALSNAQNATYKAAIGAAVAAATNVALDIFFIPRYGMAGSGWATAAAYAAALLVWLILSRRDCAPMRILFGLTPVAAACIALLLRAGSAAAFLLAAFAAAVTVMLRRGRLKDDLTLLREAWQRTGSGDTDADLSERDVGAAC